MSNKSEAFQEKLKQLLEQNQKIEAIKLYREKMGTGLKEAKEAVEQIAQKQGIEVKGGAGCFGIILFVIIFSGSAFAVFTG